MIAKWFLVGMIALGALLVVASVGKPARPITGGRAAWVVAINATYITLIVTFWRS